MSQQSEAMREKIMSRTVALGGGEKLDVVAEQDEESHEEGDILELKKRENEKQNYIN